MLIISAIGAHEGRYVATVDISNSFIQTIVENGEYKVTMILRGKLSEYLVIIALEIYIAYVVIDKERKKNQEKNPIYETLKTELFLIKNW